MTKFVMGIDIGGTKIEASLFEDHGEKGLKSIKHQRIPTLRDKGYDSVISRLTGLIKEVVQSTQLNPDQLDYIGIGLPGSVNPQTGSMINGNSQIFIDRQITQDLQKSLKVKCPFFLHNDASCFALAESQCGAGLLYEKDSGIPLKDHFAIGIILGTGCGGGLISKQEILGGRMGGGGEVGHAILYAKGKKCYCGRLGCAEQYLSGTALELTFETRARKKSFATDIFKNALDGSPISLEVANQYKRDLLEFLINLSAYFDPDYFVFGGGVSKSEGLYHGLEDELAKKVFVKGSRPKIYQHQIGDSAGVLGAALLGRQKKLTQN